MEYIEKGLLWLIMVVLSPLIVLAWVGGHIYGTVKFSFNTGYAGSVSGVEERKKEARMMETISQVMAQAHARKDGDSLQ